VRARLTELSRQDPAVEMQFSLVDQWSRLLFVALCRRYGLSPFRYPRQRHTTVMVRAPRQFVEQVLWREFTDLDADLQAYLHEVTQTLIREAGYQRRIRDCGSAPIRLMVSDFCVHHIEL